MAFFCNGNNTGLYVSGYLLYYVRKDPTKKKETFEKETSSGTILQLLTNIRPIYIIQPRSPPRPKRKAAWTTRTKHRVTPRHRNVTPTATIGTKAAQLEAGRKNREVAGDLRSYYVACMELCRRDIVDVDGKE